MSKDTHRFASTDGLTLSREEIPDLLHEDISTHVADCLGEGKLLGAGHDAVLGEAALLDSAVASQGTEPIFGEDGSGGIHVEELSLRDGGGTHEVRGRVELRADFHAAAAGDAV